MNDRTLMQMLRAQGVDTPDMQNLSPDRKALMRALARYSVPTIAMQGPAAPDTWEVRSDLAINQAQTPRVPLTFPADVVIVGTLPVVTYSTFNPIVAGTHLKDVATGGGVPSPEDIDVSMDIDLKDRKTAQQGRSTAAGSTDGTFVSLASFDIIAMRLMLYLLEGVPQVGFTFRSRYGIDSPASSGFQAPVRISLSVFTRPLGY